MIQGRGSAAGVEAPIKEYMDVPKPIELERERLREWQAGPAALHATGWTGRVIVASAAGTQLPRCLKHSVRRDWRDEGCSTRRRPGTGRLRRRVRAHRSWFRTPFSCHSGHAVQPLDQRGRRRDHFLCPVRLCADQAILRHGQTNRHRAWRSETMAEADGAGPASRAGLLAAVRSGSLPFSRGWGSVGIVLAQPVRQPPGLSVRAKLPRRGQRGRLADLHPARKLQLRHRSLDHADRICR